MIKITHRRIDGYGIEPNITQKQRSEILMNLLPSSRIAFIDLAPTDEILEFIDELLGRRHTIVTFLDHHYDTRRRRELDNIEIIHEKIVPQGGKLVFIKRNIAPSILHMIPRALWEIKEINTVIFHADFDGFYGFVKGCGLYYAINRLAENLFQTMGDDAEILEGHSLGRRLSHVGELFIKAITGLVPYYSIDPRNYEKQKQFVYQTMVDWIASGSTDRFIKKFKARVEVAAKKAEMMATVLAREAKLLPGAPIAMSDFRKVLKAGEKIDLALWKQEVLGRYGEVLICCIAFGHMGEQVYIELPKAWQKEYDLRDYLPEGVVGRVPFRVQVPIERFDEFLGRWKEKKRTAAVAALAP